MVVAGQSRPRYQLSPQGERTCDFQGRPESILRVVSRRRVRRFRHMGVAPTQRRRLLGPPMNLGPTINTAVLEAVPEFSRDGHWMFFNRVGGPGSLGGFDIWVSHREKVHDDFAWETAVNLG